MRTEIVPGCKARWRCGGWSSPPSCVFVGDAGDTEASRASRRHGIEWNNHYVAPRRGCCSTSTWPLSRARFTDDDPAGDYIPGAIDTRGVVRRDASPTSGRGPASFQLRYFGPRPLIEDNSVRSQSTTLAYLRVGYRIDAANLKVALDVFNLFDRKASDIDYFYASRLPGEPAGGRRRHPLPSGRAAALSGQSCGELLDGAPGRIRTS